MVFADHFSKVASEYAKYRPSYPLGLFSYLSSLNPNHHLAWDCATGNGQCAVGLAPYFDAVIATDASSEQIAHAKHYANVKYQQALAEKSGLKARSVDLTTVAQAIHWFDFDKFYEEVRRVSAEGAAIAIFGYGLLRCSDDKLNEIIENFYDGTLGDRFWPKERAHIDNAYASIPFPFVPLEAPSFLVQAQFDLEHYRHYLGTWSAVQRYRLEIGRDPVEELLRDSLAEAWGDPHEMRIFEAALILRAGRVA